jgi:hypothetical protein
MTLLTVSAVARKAGLTPDAVRWNARQGYLIAITVPRGASGEMRVFEESAVEQWLADREVLGRTPQKATGRRVRVPSTPAARNQRFSLICPCCDARFVQTRTNQKYCSARCVLRQGQRNSRARKQQEQAQYQWLLASS